MSIDYLDYPVGPTPSPKLIRESMGEPKEKVPLLSLTGGTFMDTTVFGSLYRYFDRPNDFDEDFLVTPELLRDAAGDIPVEYIQDLSESSSLNEFKYRVESIKERLDTREKLSQHGILGLGLTFGTAMLDPTFLAAAGLTGGLAVAGKAAQIGVTTRRALRLKSALRGTAISAAVDIPLEVTRLATDDMTDFEDMFFNVAASATLGGGIGYAFPTTSGFARNWKELVDEQKARIDSSMKGKVAEATGTVLPTRDLGSMNGSELKEYAKELGVPQSKFETVTTKTAVGEFKGPKMRAKTEDELKADIQEFLDNSPEMRAAKSAAKAVAPNERLLEFSDEVLADMIDDYQPHWSGDVLSRLPFFKVIAKREAREGTENSKKWFRYTTEDNTFDSRLPDLETYAAQNTREFQLPYYQALKAIEESEGKVALKHFKKNIAKAVRTGAKLEGLQGEAQKALQKSFSDALDHAQRMGVDISGIKPSPKYIPREAAPKAVARQIDEFGEVEVKRLIRESYAKNNPKASAAKVASVANGWFKYAQDPEAYVNARLIGGKSADKIKEIERVLKGSLDKQKDIDDVLDLLVPKGQEPHLGMTNKRIDFDEGHSIRAVSKKTGKEEIVDFNSLISSDIDYLLEKYTHRITGASGFTQMARVLDIPTAGKNAIPTLDDMIRWMNTDGQIDDVTKVSVEQVYRSIMGMPQRDIIEAGENYRKVLGGLKDLSYINVMANVGIAQLAEIGNTLASNGVRALLRIPALLKMTRDLRTGKWTDQVAAELEAFIKPSDGILNGFTKNYRMDEGLGFQETTGDMYSKGIETLRGITSGTSYINVFGIKVRNILGIGPMDDALRIGHLYSSMQTLVNTALKVKNGKILKDTTFNKARSRLRDLGLSDSELDELMEVLADPDSGVVVLKENMRDIAELHLSKFQNTQLRMKLQFALQRDLDRVIQRNKVGNKDKFFNNPTAGLIIQFREFAMNAGFKQAAYNLKRFDQTAVKAFLGTTMFAYIGYLINIHIASRKYSGVEREKFLEEALGFHEFMGVDIPRPLLAAITRSGWAGLFPAMADSVISKITPEREALFSPYFRTTGLGVGLIEGIPAYSYASDTLKALVEISRAGAYELSGGKLGGKFTEKDLRTLLRLVPLRNSIIINRPLERLVEEADLPKRED